MKNIILIKYLNGLNGKEYCLDIYNFFEEIFYKRDIIVCLNN